MVMMEKATLWKTIFMLISLAAVAFSTAPPLPLNNQQEQMVNELINRTLGSHKSAFIVSIDSNMPFRSYAIETTKAKVHIQAYDGISAAKGFHYYLQHFLNKSVYWYNDRVEINDFEIVPNISISSKCESPFIYYQNVCAWGYSYVWWSWTTWIKHIDWMAMMGVSLTIAPIQEQLWHETYLELGLTEQEINEHMSGPAFLPWLRMGNIRGWAGPMPSTLRKLQMILQRKIIERQRAFGMKVAVPSFSGYVPIAMKRIFPNVSFIVADTWNRFPSPYCCSLFLNPFEPLFKSISQVFLRKVIRSYGSDGLYFADPFNEMQPQHSDANYLHETSKHIFYSMYSVDRRAIWLMQGWMFASDSIFWTNDKIKTFLTAVPKGRLLILDLQSEQFPQYEVTQSYYGQPFIWCMLHNFGGTLGMHGTADGVNEGIRKARTMVNSTMVGVGITPEGINQNYVMYALALERAWQRDDFNLTIWFNTYCNLRYGIVDSKLHGAWQLLRNSVYSYRGLEKIHGKYMIARRPSIRLKATIWYNISDIYNAGSRMLETNSSIPTNYYYEYRHDLVDVTRQFLQVLFEQMYMGLMKAYKTKNSLQFECFVITMQDILSDMEKILATHQNFLLGPWIEEAKKWSTNSNEKELYEFNARNQITLWGPTGEIVDYATKQWSGIVQDFFQPRWKLFLDNLRISLYENLPFNSTTFSYNVFQLIEYPFNYQKKIYPIDECGDTFRTSKDIFNKWFGYFGEENVVISPCPPRKQDCT
ncbi:alpha-N-acetylglucosaminidase [Stomoxys calcitrans]|uniref:alpha-N-acetylglucosaminidase n=1 Tax=Stomoxys calcitrans TaxID=35570 RepID=UPI0027E398D4|nr:alpha-N-acetylglucosaminidase [Stomoxys calcitrans]